MLSGKIILLKKSNQIQNGHITIKARAFKHLIIN